MVATHYIGLMSGTSLDGVDAVLLEFAPSKPFRLVGQYYQPFSPDLAKELLELNATGLDEIVRSHTAGNHLSRIYARAVNTLLQECNVSGSTITAIGCHGQTIRHCPESGFTVQIGNAALLAEMTGITVVADFRSRDIAAGGQGAPLVPAFHQAAFGHPDVHRVILNIGGISNLSNLPPRGPVVGFDCGPGNLLMDAWIHKHLGASHDHHGMWAATGTPIPNVLKHMLAHPFFAAPPPKSTGRDTFHMSWLEENLPEHFAPEDVQATLLELTARCVADAINTHCRGAEKLYLCGGGAHNRNLVTRIAQLLPRLDVALTDALGIGVNWVEAAAFAWLAKQSMDRQPGNLPAVTGATGSRILGAIYPA